MVNKELKTLIFVFREALHHRNIDWVKPHGGHTKDILLNIINRNEGNDIWMNYRRELIEISNLTTI
jgi:hypothetical protein